MTSLTMSLNIIGSPTIEMIFYRHDDREEKSKRRVRYYISLLLTICGLPVALRHEANETRRTARVVIYNIPISLCTD